MVATRRGVRVHSPTKTNSEYSGVLATPSTGRRTRRTAKQEETPAQSSQEEKTCCQPDGEVGPALSPESQTSTGKRRSRCARASRLHSPEPSSAGDSTHEADASDLESCCSALSDSEPPSTRTRGRRRQPHAVSQEGDDLHSSATPASQGGHSARRGTRITRKTNVLESSDPVVSGDGDAGTVSEAESCSSMVSDSQRVTRSSRKSAPNRPLATKQSEDSEADSCTSSVSGAQVSTSTTGRATRSRREQPAPMHLDDVSEGSESPAPSRRTRAGRGKPAATVVVSEPQSCDSEGFESGPCATPRRITRRYAKAMDTMATDSDSELMDVHSPPGSVYSTRSRGTPSSSRAGSGNSSKDVLATRLLAVQCCLSDVLERANTPGAVEGEELGEGELVAVDSHPSKVTVSELAAEKSLSDSRLDSTVGADPDCTVVEEDITLTLEDDDEEDVTSTNLTSKDVPPEDAEVIEVGHRGSVIMSTTTPADVEMSETSTLHHSGVQEESTDTPEAEKGLTVITVDEKNTDTEADSEVPLSSSVVASDSPTEVAEAVDEPEMTAREQQREPLTGDKEGDVSAMPPVQGMVPLTESVELSSTQSVAATRGKRPATSGVTEEIEENDEAMEMGELNTNVDDHPSQSGSLENKSVDGNAVMETLPDGEGMEVSTSSPDAQQVDSSQATPSPSEPTPTNFVQVTSSQKLNVTLSGPELSGPEPEARDSVIVQKTGVISLLESSEDEEEEEEEEEGSGSEEEEDEERAGPSKKCHTAAVSAEGLFVIDTEPGLQADEQYYIGEGPSGEGACTEAEDQKEQDETFVDEDGDDDEDAEILFTGKIPQLKELSSRIDPGLRVKELGGLYINFDGSKSKPISGSLRKLKEQKIQDEVMKKSVIGPDFEKKDAVPLHTKHTLKLKHREEREKTTGDGWFNMKAPELTRELKGDLRVLKMRGAMDPKRFYKKNDRDGFPKYFQIGTVVDSPADFYHSRIPKKERKRTMVEELLADAEFRHNNKKKYQQIMTEKMAQGAGKRNKKNNKFHKK